MIIEPAAQFASNWTVAGLASLNLTQNEADDLYFERQNEELNHKMSKSKAYDLQMDEYWNFIQNLDKMDALPDFSEYKCEDPKCQWDRDVHAETLKPNEVLHVMIYHSAGLLIALCPLLVSQNSD